MNKIVLMFALITMPFFSHADDWDETESCRVKLKDSFAIEAKYCDDCDTDDIKFYVRGKKDNTIELKEDVIYLKKEGNVNGNGKSVLYSLWSANDDVDGIFNEDEDHLDGDTVYTIRIEFNDIEKSGNSYTVNLSYFLYDGTTLLKPGIESRVEFDHLSNSSDVFFEQDEDLFDLNCRPSSRPEPNPEPEFSVPDNVCESFPEPIQGWKQSQSKLVVTNKEVRITGWSDEYLADSQNYYTYKQDWENGSEWSTLRIGFDKGGQAWQLYQNPDSKVCNDAMGCLPGDGVAGDGSLAGNDGLVESRKAQTPTPLAAAFNSSRVLVIRMKETDANFYGKVCLSESDACSFTESGGKVVIRLKRDLKSLDIKGYNTNKTVELQLDGKRVIERFSYDSGNDLSLYFSDNAELTVKTFINTGSNPKLIFGSNVTVNVVGTDQPPGSYLNKNADFALEGAYFDYRTYQKELTLPVIYGPQASFHFKTNSGQVFKGFILAKSIVLDTSEHMYGAITSLWLDMRGSSKVSKPDYSCSSIEPNEDDYSLELTPESAFSLICEGISPTVSVLSDGKLASDFNGTVVVSIDGVEQSYSSPSEKFSIESGEENKVVSVSAYIEGDQDDTLVTGSYEFVPFKFSADDQYVVAGKSKVVKVKTLACDDNGGVVDVDNGYNGALTSTSSWIVPASGSKGNVTFEPKFVDGTAKSEFVVDESGQIKVSLEDSNFDCTGIEGCPIEGSGTLKGNFMVYSRPWAFALCSTADTNLDTATGTSSGGKAFIAAGEEFDIQVLPIKYQAENTGEVESSSAWCNAASITSNFFLDGSISNQVKLTSEVASPISYASNELLVSNDSLLQPRVNGDKQYNFTDLYWNDVGSLKVMASTKNYDSTCSSPIGLEGWYECTQLGYRNIGRFYPEHFKITKTTWDYPDTQEDASYIYMEQKFDLVQFDVSAFSSKGELTQNYGLFSNAYKVNFELSGDYAERLNIDDESEFNKSDWSGAVWSKSWSNSIEWSKLALPDGPFNSGIGEKPTVTKIGLSIRQEKNELKDPSQFKYIQKVEGETEKTTTSNTQSLLSQPDVRYGRINLDDVGGRSGSRLTVPLRVEYWNGIRFVRHADDGGTTIEAELEKQTVIWPGNEVGCDVIVEVVDDDVTKPEGYNTISDAQVDQGTLPNDLNERLLAHQDCSNPPRQQSQVWLDLDANGLPWLQYNWRGKGEENPSSVVTFGIHRGNDRVIYRGEPGLTAQ